MSLARLPLSVKRTITVVADAFAAALTLWVAIALKLDRLVVPEAVSILFVAAAVSSPALYWAVGLYRAVIRFMGPTTMLAVVAGTGLSALVVGIVDRLAGPPDLPLAVWAIYWALTLLYAIGSRFVVRYFLPRSQSAQPGLRVAIYGAGDAGARIGSVLLASTQFEPVAYVDDDPSLQGSRIGGIEVFSPARLPELVKERSIVRVLLAMPSAPRRRRREILAALESLGVHIQSLPDLSDLVSGKARIDELRDVDIADVLGRDAVPPDPQLFAKCIGGKCVLVTGAGGSIGSELCRQILAIGPRRLVLLEISELALYQIDRELRERRASAGTQVEIVPLLGSVQQRERMREVCATFGVQTIYHAAAYKHVPIVEHNVVEGIHNNVMGTWHAAEAALDTGVETFVLVSTDKAVNPANVMGAAKRLAELVLQGIQERSTSSRFCMVRFGNVLASSGSVVPLFQEQIRRGGPVTVTHPDVIRYFMTIQEAAQLVIQAGSMAAGGDVFVLDMGQPVRIDDLARRMVGLMGLTLRDAANPDGDIEIEYTGLRAGEKLFEELLIGGNVTRTEHSMILRAMEHRLPWSQLEPLLRELLDALTHFDCQRALTLLSRAVAEYGDDHAINDHVWTRKAQ
jgi:FlaA1/EpsC-like NDP-sugar epimerase